MIICGGYEVIDRHDTHNTHPKSSNQFDLHVRFRLAKHTYSRREAYPSGLHFRRPDVAMFKKTKLEHGGPLDRTPDTASLIVSRTARRNPGLGWLELNFHTTLVWLLENMWPKFIIITQVPDI